MPEVIVRKGEPVDRALKRLKSKLDAEGILEEIRRLRAFETPNQKSRRKAKANDKRGRTTFRFNTSSLSWIRDWLIPELEDAECCSFTPHPIALAIELLLPYKRLADCLHQ